MLTRLNHRTGRLFFVAAAVLAGGCVKETPNDATLTGGALPASTKTPGAYAAAQAGEAAATKGWLASFRDPKLEALVMEALSNNRDLAAAKARLDQSAAKARQAGADLAPQLGYSANASAGQDRSGGPRNERVGAGLNLSWEVDLWGRLSAGQRAAQEAFASTEADYEFARRSLAAQTAKAYFFAIQAVKQEAIAKEFAGIQTRTVELVQLRNANGTATDFDVALQRSALATAMDRCQQATSARENAVRSLELLLGRYPKAELDAGGVLPELPPPPPAGLPSTLLERRPDIIAARRRVAAAFNQVESAKAARLPRLSITATAGLASNEFQRMSLDNAFWNLGANLVGPIFDGGRIREQIKIENARQAEALALYGKTALTAFRDVETALAEAGRLEARRDLVAAADRDQTKALALAELRLTAGSIDQLDLLQVQAGTLNTRTAALAVEVARLTNRVDFHLALGGDYTPPSVAPEDNLPAAKVVE